MSETKLQQGKFYKLVNGQVVGPLDPNRTDDQYCWKSDWIYIIDEDSKIVKVVREMLTFTQHGRYRTGNPCEYDIAEVANNINMSFEPISISTNEPLEERKWAVLLHKDSTDIQITPLISKYIAERTFYKVLGPVKD